MRIMVKFKDLAALTGYLSSIALLFLIVLGVVPWSGLAAVALAYFIGSAIVIAGVGG